MKNDYSSNRKGQPSANSLHEEKGSPVPDLKELAKRAFSRIHKDKTWTGHIFSTDKGRVHGVLLHKKSLSAVFEKNLSSCESDSFCKEIDEATQFPNSP